MGSTKVSAPSPSEAEVNLQNKQAATLETQNQILQDQLAETKRTRALMEQFMPTTPEEIAAYKGLQQKELELTNLSYDLMKKQAEQGQTPLEKANEEVGLLQAERTKKALAGQLPIDEGTQQRKAEEYAALKEQMDRMGNPIVGDNPDNAVATTTAGNQALMAFKKKWGGLESQMRQGAIDAGQAAVIGSTGLTADIANRNWAQQNSFRGTAPNMLNQIGGIGSYGWAPLQARFSGLSAGYSNAIQPYQFNRQMQYNAGMQMAANRASNVSGGMQAGAAVAGAIAIAI